jgi:hypothetical protein
VVPDSHQKPQLAIELGDLPTKVISLSTQHGERGVRTPGAT